MDILGARDHSQALGSGAQAGILDIWATRGLDNKVSPEIWP